MSSAWSCPHNLEERCAIRQQQPCQPGYPGCVLHGRIRFADPDHPANQVSKPAEEKLPKS
ncbi:hypothetical protein [Desulfurispira natronophila]|uniref:Uncharacterized protein n=1 Tax=Desulfurispira natronophila TaxID=682562 RepID=A0A7W7Y273_9BACT|nr:hypothetical protein [Desulfurispira natronophila]MBB5020707.1 hypothetical protein [Desulfurispira natronophila]